MDMTQSSSTSTLIYGCDTISRNLRYCMSPMGILFKFDTGNKNRPKPLPLTVVLAIFSTILIMLFLDYILFKEFGHWNDDLYRFDLVSKSTFIRRLVKIFELYRLAAYIAVLIITVSKHGFIVNVMATKNNIISRKEQISLARNSFLVFLFKAVSSCVVLLSFLSISNLPIKLTILYGSIASVLLLFLTMTTVAPVIYTCYLGAALGKHVENFSRRYIDTMFDQFTQAVENEHIDSCKLQTCYRSRQHSSNSSDSGSSFFTCFHLITKLITDFLIYISRRLRETAAQLNSQKYPELPEMEMTKLSYTDSSKITDSMRSRNSRLIRTRLRKTQIMLSELRDVVNDINKMSSPIIIMQILHETILIVAISTCSIQAKIYKSINPLILPTVVNVTGLTITVGYVCTCLDDTTAQIKLMINKLFDFIILNHRVCDTKLDKSPGSQCTTTDRENEALSETWSQFQYTRKLANTIQFTMGGLLPVSRRMVLLILGHILSAVFISIEIMSIVDTSSPRELPGDLINSNLSIIESQHNHFH